MRFNNFVAVEPLQQPITHVDNIKDKYLFEKSSSGKR